MIWRTWQAASAIAGAVALIYFITPQDLDMAHLATQAGAWHDSVGYWERLERAHPEDAAARRELTLAYERAGQPLRAMGLLEADAKGGALDRPARERYVHLALAAGQPARAAKLLADRPERLGHEELLKLVKVATMGQDLKTARRLQAALVARTPGDRAAIARARDLAEAASDPGEAAMWQRRLFEAQPDARSRDRLVALERQANHPLSALAAWEGFRGPDEGAGWALQAAKLAALAGQPASEIAHLREALAARPALAPGKRLLDLLEAAHDASAAEIACTVAALAPADAGLARRRDALLLAQGRTDEALAERRRAARRSPLDGNAHQALVKLALARSRRDVAIGELVRWNAVCPGDRAARHQLAVVYGWDRRPREACRVYQALLADLPAAARARSAGTPDLATEIRWRSEWVALASPSDDAGHAGRNNLRRVLSYEPWHLNWRRRLALAMGQVGEGAEALAQQRIVARDPAATPADHLQLASLELASGDRPRAMAMLRQLASRGALAVGDNLLWRAYDAARQAGAWADADFFMARLAKSHPARRDYWVALATAREHAGQLEAAARAWQTAIELGNSSAAERIKLAALWQRLGRSSEALAFLERVGPGASAGELRTRAMIARALHRPAAEVLAWQAFIARRPADTSARLALADLLAARGDAAGALREEDRALDAAGHGDAHVLGAIAARRFYTGRLEAARPLVARLASMPRLEPRALRLLADVERDDHPARAAHWLDRYHEAVPGDAASWFARGEAARATGDAARATEAYERAVAIAESDPNPDPSAEALAAAAERLGRAGQAEATWRDILERHPDRLSAWIALGRHHLQAHHMKRADACLASAVRLAPGSLETRTLKADLLQARGQYAEALPVLASLRAEHPELVALGAAEARVRYALGQRRAAQHVARNVLDRAPDAPGLQADYRTYREAGAGRVELAASHEGTALLQKNAIATSGRSVLSDAVQLRVGLAQLEWGSAAPAVQEGRLGVTVTGGALQVLGDLALDTRADVPRRPYGSLAARWTLANWRADAGVAERRWEDAGASVAAGGRERGASAGLTWQPDPHVSVAGQGELGQLSTAAGELGASNTWRAEAVYRPDPEGPWQLLYQFRHRHWGEAAGPLGLPPETNVHDVWLGYRQRWGSWWGQVSPGYSLASGLEAGTPMLAASLTWEPSVDLAIALEGGWSAQGLELGQAGGYQRVGLTGHWYF